MTDGEALLKAILAQPEEDMPRLVYADWLDEQGNEIDSARAEFIRLQMELAKEHPPLYRDILECREERLHAKYAKKWLDGRWEESRVTPGAHDLSYSRGFCVQLFCPWEFWMDRSGVILKRHPIEKVTLTTIAVADGFPLSPDQLRSNPEWDKIAFEYTDYVSWLPPWRPVRTTNLSMGDV